MIFGVLTLEGQARFLRRRRFAATNRTCEGIRYACINYYGNPDRLPWRRLEGLLGRLRGSILLPVGLSPPLEMEFSPPDLSGWQARIMENTVISVLERVPLPVSQKQAVLVDQNARHMDFAVRLAEYCGEVSVVTCEMERYETLREELMDACGAHLTVTDRVLRAQGAPLVVCHNPAGAGLADVPGLGAVFGCAAPAQPHGQAIDSAHPGRKKNPEIPPEERCAPVPFKIDRYLHTYRVSLPDTIKAYLPPGIDETAFAGALCGSGMRGLNSLAGASMQCAGRCVTAETAAAFLLERMQRPSPPRSGPKSVIRA